MRKKLIWLLASSLMVLALLAAACAPAEEAAPVGQTPDEKTPAAEEEVTPGEKETAAPTEGKDMVKVSWKNGDGVLIEKEIERPQYGGTGRYSRATAILAWDEAFQSPWGIASYNLAWDGLIQGEWPRGPVVTNEVSWLVLGWMREDYSYGGLAESWEFPDMETAIFHIRKGVYWQDKEPVNGREFDAHDVVFNIKRIYQEIKTSTMWGMAGEASAVLDVYAEDDWTVVLKSPPGQIGKTWEYVADWSYMIPPEVVEKYGDMNQWENVVGTGPFILTDYVPMSSATYLRNPNYWMEDPLIPGNQLPYLDGVKLFLIPDKSTELAAIRTAKIDWLHRQERENALSVINSNPEIIYLEYDSDVFRNLGWRVDKPDLPFQDINVRRALHMAINQQEIVDTYFDGVGKIVLQTVMDLEMFADVFTPIDELPPSADGFDNRKMFGYYPEEAKQMLADAGYPNGFKFSVVMTNSPIYVDHMSMAKAYWEKIGVEMKMDVREAGARATIFQRKTHEEAIMGGRWGGEPYSAFCVRKGNMWNWAMVDQPIFDDYYNEMSALYFQPKERDAVMKEMNLAIIDYAPYYMLPVGIQYTLYWPWVKNFDGIHSMGLGGYYFQKYMWIDEDLKESMGY